MVQQSHRCKQRKKLRTFYLFGRPLFTTWHGRHTIRPNSFSYNLWAHSFPPFSLNRNNKLFLYLLNLRDASLSKCEFREEKQLLLSSWVGNYSRRRIKNQGRCCNGGRMKRKKNNKTELKRKRHDFTDTHHCGNGHQTHCALKTTGAHTTTTEHTVKKLRSDSICQ